MNDELATDELRDNMLRNAIRFNSVNDSMIELFKVKPWILPEMMSKDTVDVISNVLIRMYGTNEGLCKTLEYVKAHINEKDTAMMDIKETVYQVCIQMAEHGKNKEISNFNELISCVKENKIEKTINTFVNIFNTFATIIGKKIL